MISHARFCLCIGQLQPLWHTRNKNNIGFDSKNRETEKTMNLLKTETCRRSKKREVSFPLVRSQTTGTNSDSSTEKFDETKIHRKVFCSNGNRFLHEKKKCWPNVELIYRVFAAPLFATFTIKCYNLSGKHRSQQ